MKASLVFKQYIWMIETIRRCGPLTLEQFNRLWERCSLSQGREMPRSTFNYNREAIEEMFGITIACNKRDHVYYIRNMGDLRGASLQRWMMETLSIGNMLSESQALHERILLDGIPVGGHILDEILRAMRQGVRISMEYQKFRDTSPKEVVGSPLCLKASGRRWYVVLDTPDHDEPAVYSLDRIRSIGLTDERFTMPPDFDGEAFFHDSYGVFAGSDFAVQHVVLKAYGVQSHYIRTLPLHHSQQETSSGKEWTIFEYDIRPTIDFIQVLLSYGSAIEIMSPQSLRQRMKEEVARMAQLY